MAFNNAGNPVWVAADASIGWSYGWGDNHGAQYAMANCKSPDGLMQTTAQGDRLEDNGNVAYFVWFHNLGPQSCYHNLNGGGLS